MAYATRDSRGYVRVIFKALNGKRSTIYCGEISKRDGDDVAKHVDAILSAAMTRSPVAPRTAQWLGDIPEAFHGKLQRVGLVGPRETKAAETLGTFLDAYLARRTDAKSNTLIFYGHTIRNLKKFFGEGRTLESITPAEADDFRRFLIAEKLSPATVARRCGLARTFFRDAVRRRLVAANPFEGVGGGPKSNPERSRFIEQEVIGKVIAACPDAEWRCCVALSRFGGLRVPSEALLLRWTDIDWDAGRMVIHSPKTEHHEGKATRVCPIFHELRSYLEELDAIAPKGAEYVLQKLRPSSAAVGDWKATNLRTQFERIILRAGLTPWPRLWHNLRASRQTELTEVHPSHVVAAWLGNTEAVARKHYLMTLESHFDKATRIPTRPVQTPEVIDGRAIQNLRENERTPWKQGVLMGGTGFEPVTFGV